MLYLAGIIITFFLVFILLSKKGKCQADKILALWLFVTGIHLVLFYIHSSGKYTEFPYLLGLELPLPLLHGPFLYLYTSSLSNQLYNKRNSLLHFAPFFIAIFALIPFFRLSLAEKIIVYQNEGVAYEQLMAVMYASIVISGIVYSLLSLKKLADHKKKITNQFSHIEKINLAWLRYLILGTGIIWLAIIFRDDDFIFSAVVLYVFFIGYFGIKQVGIFTNRHSFETALEQSSEMGTVQHVGLHTVESVIDNIPERVKYEKSALSSQELESIHIQLTTIMDSEMLYKNPELSLSDLSQKLNVHPNILSQVINSIEQKNFFDYVNRYRIEEFKRMALRLENQKFTLLSLAFDCGFNSKTSFNRSFKKVTGHSPTEYLKQIEVSLD